MDSARVGDVTLLGPSSPRDSPSANTSFVACASLDSLIIASSSPSSRPTACVALALVLLHSPVASVTLSGPTSVPRAPVRQTIGLRVAKMQLVSDTRGRVWSLRASRTLAVSSSSSSLVSGWVWVCVSWLVLSGTRGGSVVANSTSVYHQLFNSSRSSVSSVGACSVRASPVVGCVAVVCWARGARGGHAVVAPGQFRSSVVAFVSRVASRAVVVMVVSCIISLAVASAVACVYFCYISCGLGRISGSTCLPPTLTTVVWCLHFSSSSSSWSLARVSCAPVGGAVVLGAGGCALARRMPVVVSSVASSVVRDICYISRGFGRISGCPVSSSSSSLSPSLAPSVLVVVVISVALLVVVRGLCYSSLCGFGRNQRNHVSLSVFVPVLLILSSVQSVLVVCVCGSVGRHGTLGALCSS
jgi:hypothetical protein